MKIFFKILSVIFVLMLLGGVGWFGYGEIKQYRENNAKKISIVTLSQNSATDMADENAQEEKERDENAGDAKNTKQISDADTEKDSESKTASQNVEQNKNNDDVETKTQSSGKTKVNLISWGYEGASSRKIDTIVVHSSYDALGGEKYDVEGILKEYKQYGVSAHYLIDREGTIWQLVAEKNIAYHAGQSSVPDSRTSVNNFSIGIELANTEKDNYTDAQYSSLNSLIAQIKKRYSIKYVLGHNDIAPGRKTDPWNINWSKVDR